MLQSEIYIVYIIENIPVLQCLIKKLEKIRCFTTIKNICKY